MSRITLYQLSFAFSSVPHNPPLNWILPACFHTLQSLPFDFKKKQWTYLTWFGGERRKKLVRLHHSAWPGLHSPFTTQGAGESKWCKHPADTSLPTPCALEEGSLWPRGGLTNIGHPASCLGKPETQEPPRTCSSSYGSPHIIYHQIILILSTKPFCVIYFCLYNNYHTTWNLYYLSLDSSLLPHLQAPPI